jgi:hypothetical protein
LKDKKTCGKENLFEIIDLVLKPNQNKVSETSNGNKVCIFDDGENSYSLEMLKKVNNTDIDEDYLFFRIGRKKEIEGAIKRNKSTLISEEILDKKQQEKYDLEICTYLLIDKINGVILELFGQFAPSINSFINMINKLLPQNLKDKYVTLNYEKILTQKMIDSFKNEGVRLSKIAYTYNIPQASVLKSLGLDIKQINALEELDLFQVEVNIKSRPNLPLTKSPDKIKYAINAFSECIKDIKDTLVFRGTTSKSQSKKYKFTEEEVTYPITINNYIAQGNLTIKLSLDEMAEQIYDKMKLTYENNVDDILEYIK